MLNDVLRDCSLCVCLPVLLVATKAHMVNSLVSNYMSFLVLSALSLLISYVLNMVNYIQIPLLITYVLNMVIYIKIPTYGYRLNLFWLN